MGRLKSWVLGGVLSAAMGLCAPAGYAQQPAADATELAFWQSVGNSGNVKMLQAYLDAYPDGSFAPLAQIQIAELGGSAGSDRGPSAELTAEGAKGRRPQNNPSGDRCEELAAHPEDEASTFPGVSSVTIRGHVDEAIATCLEAFKSGDPKYAFALGRAYYVKSDPANHEKFFELAADAGHVLATYWLAIGYIEGDFNTPKDWPKAAELLARPSQANHARSLLFLGQYYAFHAKDPMQKSRAEPLFVKAGELGNAYAWAYLGHMYETGTGVAKQQIMARAYYENSIEAGGDGAGMGKYYSARMYFKDIERVSSGLSYHYFSLGADRRLRMLRYLEETAPNFPDAYDMRVTETARFLYDVAKFGVEEYSLDPATQSRLKRDEWEDAAELRERLMDDLAVALNRRASANPAKFGKQTEQQVASHMSAIRSDLSSIDQTLSAARRKLVPIEAYRNALQRGDECSMLVSMYNGAYAVASVNNNCELALEYALVLTSSVDSGEPHRDTFNIVLQPGEGRSLQASVKTRSGYSSEAGYVVCPAAEGFVDEGDKFNSQCKSGGGMLGVKTLQLNALTKINQALLNLVYAL